jgi:hypothetical protein
MNQNTFSSYYSRENLYKIVSEEFSMFLSRPSDAVTSSHMRVGNLPTVKPDPKLVREKIERGARMQKEIAYSAGVRKEVVKDILKGRFYKKSPPQERLINWLFKNGFEDCFPKKEKPLKVACSCPHCGSRHKTNLFTKNIFAEA